MIYQARKLIQKYKVYIKYLISGGTAASVDLILLFLFTHFLGFHYLISAILAFMIAFFVSFYLQKFWTFRDNRKEIIYGQMAVYLTVALVNLGLNTGLMYLFVEYLRVWYLLAQVMAGAMIAVESFLIYRFFIFNHSPNSLNIEN